MTMSTQHARLIRLPLFVYLILALAASGSTWAIGKEETRREETRKLEVKKEQEAPPLRDGASIRDEDKKDQKMGRKVKKKAAKTAGAAAVTGVATKKLKSRLTEEE